MCSRELLLLRSGEEIGRGAAMIGWHLLPAEAHARPRTGGAAGSRGGSGVAGTAGALGSGTGEMAGSANAMSE